MSQIDISVLESLVADGLIARRSHPSASLLIWNYTNKAAYDKVWNEYTMMCRGLITTPDGEIVARPFPKFFNLEEWVAAGRKVPNENFEVFEKLDGSLGILYWANGEPAIASRGSFDSEQARAGTAMLRGMDQEWAAGYTFLFEIIYPENRIVCNYGDRRELVLLAVVETDTGVEIDPRQFNDLSVARRYDGINDLEAIRELGGQNEEGFVVRFSSGLRLKIKLADYVRLHRLLTGVTPRRVWEILSAGQSLDEFMRDTPEEFSSWLRSVEATLRGQFEEIFQLCTNDFNREPTAGIERKAVAERFKQCQHPAILFRMLDGKDATPLIWKTIYPPPAAAFRCDVDA